ncbi:MAG: TPM domain-containing protein [Spirochaetales bacterium]
MTSAARTARRPIVAAAATALLAIIVPLSAPAQDLPAPQGFVNDFANVIPADAERSMRGIITALRDQTGAEIAVVTVESMSPYPTIEDFGIALAEEWGVGSESDDAGAILIVALEEREVRIEVGYGLEGAIPDGRAGRLLDDYVVPYLRDNNYGAGLLNGTAALAEVIADEYGVTLTNVEPERRASPDGGSSLDFGDLIYVVFFLFAVGGRWFFWPLLFAGRRRGFFGGGFGSSSGFSSGGRSSGFSGFGGGGFGGGGASRGF